MPTRKAIAEYEYEEIAKTIYENLVIDPEVTDGEIAAVATRLLKRPVSESEVARIREETEPWLRRRAEELTTDWDHVDPRLDWYNSARSGNTQPRSTDGIPAVPPDQYRPR